MERGVKECCGLNFKSVSFGELFLNKTMLFAYLLLAIGLIGWIQIYGLRFGHDFVNVKDMIGVNADNAKELALAMKEQIFGMHHIEEVPRTEPWGIFVANYMFMLYTGSAIILLVAIGELLHMKNVEKIAPLFSLFGLAIVLGGMTSIASDWGNPINMYNMFLHPQLHSGMWMMLPLYLIYIPFTIIEIYFMMTTNREKARKVAGILLIVGILIEFAEFYIQSILFSLNVPRHLWTFDSFQPFYLIITGFTAAFGVLAILSAFVLKNKPYYSDIMGSIRKGAIAWIIILGIYELYAGSIMPADYKENMINGLFKNWFMIGFIGIGTILPLLLLAKKSNVLTILAGVFLIIGAFINRCLFVYGGNSVPMTNRFGIGPEAFSTYNVAEIEKAIFEAPHTMEILIIIGCLGVSIAIYKLLDTLLDVSNPPH